MAKRTGTGKISDKWSVELEEDEWRMVIDCLYLQSDLNRQEGYSHPTLARATKEIGQIFEEKHDENN